MRALKHLSVFEEVAERVTTLEARLTEAIRLLLDLRERVERLETRVNGRKKGHEDSAQ